MADIWWKAHPHDLHRLQDRISTVYVERSHVDRDENAVVVINKKETVRIPAALVAAMLLGPGTRITHAAAALLADSGTTICWIGQQGVRMYAAGIGPSRGAGLLMQQAYLVTRPKERLKVARAMYSMRFPGEDVSELTMQQLRGREGTRVRRIYREHASRTGIAWQGRKYIAGDAHAAGDDLNRVLSAANAALYGISHAVITGLGASPGLGFVHTGSAMSFVLDIADLYKAEYTIPLAFDLVADELTEERDARLGLRDLIAERRLLPRIVHDVRMLLAADGAEDDPAGPQLWDDKVGTVDGGTNWADKEADLIQPGFGEQQVTIIGPELETPAEW
ncbi:type I-E CRISPR-associated endonuclease Cas1 [Nocardia speluncae]|uniref:CRISPR-associated endonuclease Cas1 n=1 Tax=Nocardia speluncae TaxID=419477 RepID=A0A846XEN8_9NOCA|nr:type I-E CRISPR-associated endonuclease Cas1e [Nocardia speluncae]NKY33867.1 type I-E CRISPR-associated endonuclease Cas1 [Nocardia speluncae]